MRIDILSLFPGYFKGPFDESIIKRARDKGLVDIRLVDIRDFSEDRHHRVDDSAYGGGPGMVMMPQPVVAAIRSTRTTQSKVVYLSPQGAPLTAAKCRELATWKHLIMLCGHYEGIDERVLESEVDEEISIGDYVLTNGCLSAIVLVDSVLRFVPGVIGHASSAVEDSFEQGILDCPHYTRPPEFEGKAVPEVLLSGDHALIKDWRHRVALERTRRVRPDLYVQYVAASAETALTNKGRKGRRRVQSFMDRMTLGVANLKTSIGFYSDVLGLELIRKGTNTAVFDLGNQELLLIGGGLPRSVEMVGQGEVVFEIQAQDEESFGELVRWAKQTSGLRPEFRLGTKTSSEGNQIVQLQDPDGYLWSVRWER